MSITTQLKTLLIQAGLTEAETLVYTELLNTPADSKWQLVNRTGLDRNAIYRAFEKLTRLNMVTRNNHGYKALSLNGLIAELKKQKRQTGKLSEKLQTLSPYLGMPKDTIHEIETYFTKDQITEAYLFMARQDYSINHDIGDFETLASYINNWSAFNTFLSDRMKHATAHAAITTDGPFTQYFSTKKAQKKHKASVDLVRITMNHQLINFADTSDYVLFINIPTEEEASATLVKSKPIADIQRSHLRYLSQLTEK